MKYFNLFKTAVVVAIFTTAINISADTNYFLTQDWKRTDNSTLSVNEVRQGVGMNGTIYINCKSDQSIYAVTKDGMTKTTFTGGKNCGINRDEAGNLIISNAPYPSSWTSRPEIFVVSPKDGSSRTITLISDLLPFHRSDFLGKCEGNLLTGGGNIYIEGGSTAQTNPKVSTGVSLFVIKEDGTCDEDKSRIMTTDETSFSSSTSGIFIPFIYAGAEDFSLMYINRSANPVVYQADGDNLKVFRKYNITNRGSSNGGDVFVLNGKTYYVHPLKPNYTDGFAIECLEDETYSSGTTYSVKQVITQAATLSANPNGIQCNWLNAEVVDNNTAKIYQYVPGATGYCAEYTFTVADPTAATLAELVTTGTTDSWYEATDLQVGYYHDGVLYCKDNNGFASKDASVAGQIDYMKNYACLQTDDYDQSNWIAVKLPAGFDETAAESLVGSTLNSVVGKFDASTLTLTAASMPTAKESDTYELNTYVVPSFGGTQSGTYQGESRDFFFVQPKPMEVAVVKWAQYDAANNKFVIPTNTPGFSAGEVALSADYDASTLVNGNVYELTGLITRSTVSASSAKRKASANGATYSYEILPFNVENNTTTGVKNVDATKTISNVRYYNPAGAESLTPFSGINIVVTTFTDGSTSTSKVVK